jgi:hypothetical protein
MEEPVLLIKNADADPGSEVGVYVLFDSGRCVPVASNADTQAWEAAGIKMAPNAFSGAQIQALLTQTHEPSSG